jgi:hypothetical protein
MSSKLTREYFRNGAVSEPSDNNFGKPPVTHSEIHEAMKARRKNSSRHVTSKRRPMRRLDRTTQSLFQQVRNAGGSVAQLVGSEVAS